MARGDRLKKNEGLSNKTDESTTTKTTITEKKDSVAKKIRKANRLTENYRRDYLVLNAYSQFKNQSWSYFYVYPEYFEASPVPGPQVKNSYMFTQEKTVHYQASNSGTIVIHFCPGVTQTFYTQQGLVNLPVYEPEELLELPELDDDNLLVYLRIKQENKQIKARNEVARIEFERETDRIMEAAAVETDPGWLLVGQETADVRNHVAQFVRNRPSPDEFRSLRCIGGFMKIEFGSQTTGMFKHYEQIRTERDPERHELLNFIGQGEQIKSNLIFRYRASTLKDLLQTSNPTDSIGHNVLLYSMPANSNITITLSRTFQGQLVNAPDSISYIKHGSYSDFAEAKKEVKHLLKLMPKQLKHHPLDDPIHYHDALFDPVRVKHNLFPVKKIVNFEPQTIKLPNVTNLGMEVSAGNVNETVKTTKYVVNRSIPAKKPNENIEESDDSSILAENDDEHDEKKDIVKHMKIKDGHSLSKTGFYNREKEEQEV